MINKTIQNLLEGKAENHIFPFFWQHGEDETTLRKYVNVIHEANCGAFCVESRPHPDFCGDKWWADMDAILDEAKKLGMKVWILDDAHFPTGYANGALETAPAGLCRQSICASKNGKFPPKFKPNLIERFVMKKMKKKQRRYDDDKIISVIKAGNAAWTVGLTRNLGFHRDYINMLSRESVRLLIDAVYEKHWERYKAYFGGVIEGFFSDEPELGNGHMYDDGCKLGTDNDFPFSDELARELEEKLGQNWADRMYLLWENNAGKSETAHVRLTYMNAVTKLFRDNFSYQIGDWCRERGVMYIGHVIEDNGQHTQTGSGPGHYFRALEGQDMAGIDDIGRQVFPQGEDCRKGRIPGIKRNSDFYHFMLGRLASSAAAIEPLKKGRAMCEIFGDYGWSAGVYLEKYLADHFMVRGINYFVPHAFSPKAFPDPDCPPHFYAHGHNPQYRHFGELIKYMNRVCALISSGERAADAALLYHAETEWQGGEFVPNEKMARLLEENHLSFDIVPRDYFDSPGKYNDRRYKTVIDCQSAEIPGGLAPEAVFTPKSSFMRVSHIKGETDIYYFVNEGAETYSGEILLPIHGNCCAYDAWENKLRAAQSADCENGTKISALIEPRKSLFIVFGEEDLRPLKENNISAMEKIPLAGWVRSVCEGARYPGFGEEKKTDLPDNLAKEQPGFSGFVRYKTVFEADKKDKLLLVIENAAEGVEVFINGVSRGIQIVPAFRYDLTGFVKDGKNGLVIEVATTLERECYSLLEIAEKLLAPKPTAKSGLTGKVLIYKII